MVKDYMKEMPESIQDGLDAKAREADRAPACELFYRLLVSMMDHPSQRIYQLPHKDATVHLRDYITYVTNVAQSPAPVILGACMYIQRFLSAYPENKTKDSGPHRMFLSALICSTKYHEDITYTNTSWAKIARYFPASEISASEVELLKMLNWQLHITREEFAKTLAWMRSHAPSLKPPVRAAKEKEAVVTQLTQRREKEYAPRVAAAQAAQRKDGKDTKKKLSKSQDELEPLSLLFTSAVAVHA